MRIGLIVDLHGRSDASGHPSPSWSETRAAVMAAESAGFDIVVYEDALMYPGDDVRHGVWESVSVSGALAEATTSIEFGPSVFNGVYRNPGLVANIASTLAHISRGRFVLGIGAGNTPDDYVLYGFPIDHRFSRFADAIEIIHEMLQGGPAHVDGEFWTTDGAEMVFHPGEMKPRLVIAAGGPKMMGLTARYADEWNWWAMASDPDDNIARMVTQIEAACESVGRDPKSLLRSVDVYRINPLGNPNQISEDLLNYTGLGFDEVRCAFDSDPASLASAVEAMEDVVSLVHRS